MLKFFILRKALSVLKHRINVAFHDGSNKAPEPESLFWYPKNAEICVLESAADEPYIQSFEKPNSVENFTPGGKLHSVAGGVQI